jgi:membrane-bound lytic murein transglycosylase B
MVRFFKLRYFFSILMILGIVLSTNYPGIVLAETTVADAQANRARLERELADLEKELTAVTNQLNQQKGQSSSLKNDIAVLTSKINQNKLDIRSKNVLIEKLGGEINDRNKTIYSLTEKIEREHASLAQLLKKAYELQDETSFVHVLMSNQTLSDFYQDLDDFQSIQDSINESLGVVRINKVQVEFEKTDLIKKQDEQENAKAKIEAAKRAVEANEREKQKLLSISKGKESEYEKLKAEKEKKAADIRARLFNFAGGQTKAIPFGTAITYAEQAQSATGVPAALVLAILTQESALGANVGKCTLLDENTGSAININSKAVFKNGMKPDRDVKPFIEITSNLGMDYKTTVISCPIAGVAGWGGAMGPAQFIPSTWKGVESRIRAITGSANPWNARDSITASSVYLSQIGAKSDYSSQIRAACRYYGTGGSNCTYGRQVMNRVSSIQSDIDYLKEYGVSRR